MVLLKLQGDEAAMLYAVVRSFWAELASRSALCSVPLTIVPGGNPVTAVPGLTPRSPLIRVGKPGPLVTVVCARTAKLVAAPSGPRRKFVTHVRQPEDLRCRSSDTGGHEGGCGFP